MSYYKKYLKYKNKYLELKKQLGGRRIRTISNSGALEGMTNQCFWISILNYLQRNGHPALTLRQLRTDAGLGADTEHTMFDNDYKDKNGNLILFNAATRIAELYNLNIQVYGVNRNGEIIGPRAHIGNGLNFVEIAQFGLAHFELINGDNGAAFVPAVIVKGTLTKDIDQQKKGAYLQLNETELLLKDLTNVLYKNINDNISTEKARSDIESLNIKEESKKEQLDAINKIITEQLLELHLQFTEIDKIKLEIKSLQFAINDIEKN